MIKRWIGFTLLLASLAAVSTIYSAPLALNFKAETQADSSRPVLFVVLDTATVTDVSQYPPVEYLRVHCWPDSTVVRLFGISWRSVEVTSVRVPAAVVAYYNTLARPITQMIYVLDGDSIRLQRGASEPVETVVPE